MKVDIGKLTPDETKDLLAQCIDALPEADTFAVLEAKLTKAQKEELGESWFNIDREGF